MNLQLCFINNSESEEEEEKKEGEVSKKEISNTRVTTNTDSMCSLIWDEMSNSQRRKSVRNTNRSYPPLLNSSLSSPCSSYWSPLLMKRGTVQVHKNPQPPAKPEKSKSRGLRNTLRNLRDRLRTDHKTLVSQTFNLTAASFTPKYILSFLFSALLSSLSSLQHVVLL